MPSVVRILLIEVKFYLLYEACKIIFKEPYFHINDLIGFRSFNTYSQCYGLPV